VLFWTTLTGILVENFVLITGTRPVFLCPYSQTMDKQLARKHTVAGSWGITALVADDDSNATAAANDGCGKLPLCGCLSFVVLTFLLCRRAAAVCHSAHSVVIWGRTTMR
jgi:hypothetical protein